MKKSAPAFEPETASSNQAIREDLRLRYPSIDLDAESQEEFGKKFNQLTRKDLTTFWHIMADRYAATGEKDVAEQLEELKILLKNAQNERDEALARQKEAEEQLRNLECTPSDSEKAPAGEEAQSDASEELKAAQAELQDTREQLTSMTGELNEAREALEKNNKAMSTLEQVKVIIGVSPESNVLKALTEKLNLQEKHSSELRNEIRQLRQEQLRSPRRTNKLAWTWGILFFISSTFLMTLSLCGVKVSHIPTYPWVSGTKIFFKASPSDSDYRQVAQFHSSAMGEGGKRAFAICQKGLEMFPDSPLLLLDLGILYLDGLAPDNLPPRDAYIEAGKYIKKAADKGNSKAMEMCREFEAASEQAR